MKEGPQEMIRVPKWYYGGCASAMAACVTHPLDLLKVHLQTAKSAKEFNLLKRTQRIVNVQGYSALFNGLSASLFRQMTYSTTRFGLYEVLKQTVDDDPRRIPFHKKVLLAGISGAAGGFLGTPGDVINVRMQNDIKLPYDLRRNYTSVVNGLSTVIRYEGYRALFTGTSMATTRSILMTIGQLSMYDQFKHLLITQTPEGTFGDDTVTHLLASLMAGTTATTLTQPLDVIKTRFMNETIGHYKGPLDVASSIYKDFGPIGFFRGFVPAFIRLAPHTMLTFVFLEEMRKRFGTPIYDKPAATILNINEDLTYMSTPTREIRVPDSESLRHMAETQSLVKPPNQGKSNDHLTHMTDSSMEISSVPNIEPTMTVNGPNKLSFDITLFQYCSCPFCCKTRVFLDYFGVKYNIVEVDPVFRKKLSWSKYKKVPTLLAHSSVGSAEQKVYQVSDSSVIISSLGSYLMSKRTVSEPTTHNKTIDDLAKILVNYQSIEVEDEDGKKRQEVPNKYFLMLGDIESTELEKRESNLAEERYWRDWTDRVLVHSLSPNIYRTIPEAFQAFNNFSSMGKWDEHFTAPQRIAAIYMGSAVMWLVGKRLKKKYNLKDDVRESLYDNCREWRRAIGNDRTFLGGDKPNLADLSVFGVLTSIEGCTAFNEVLQNTDIGTWYSAMKDSCNSHQGIQLVQSI